MPKEKSEKKTRNAGGRPLTNTERRAHVGQVIRRYRTAAGMDQAALAVRLGCTKTAIGNWELGLTRPDIDNVPRICRALKIPVTELLGIESEAALPREDQSLLETYHRLDRFDQNTIRQLMERLLFQQDRKEKARLRQAYRPLCLYAEAASAGVAAPMADHAAAAYVGALTRVDRLVAGIVRVQAVGLVFLDERFAVDDEDAHLPGLDRGAGR